MTECLFCNRRIERDRTGRWYVVWAKIENASDEEPWLCQERTTEPKVHVPVAIYPAPPAPPPPSQPPTRIFPV